MWLFSYTIRRLGSLIPVLLGMALIVFMMIRAIPGNPAQTILGQQATATAVAALTKDLGLDKPWHIQFWSYLKGLFSGDLGVSLRTRQPISQEVWPYLAATMELALVAMIVAVFIGVNAGIISAWFQNSWFDYIAMIVALIGVSMPIFWLGLMEQYVVALQFDLLPTSGRDNIRDPVQAITNLYLIDTLISGRFDQSFEVIKHLILPGFALATIPMAIIARMTRSSML